MIINKASRQSKNIVDSRDPKVAKKRDLKQDLADKSTKLSFRKKDAEEMTRHVNRFNASIPTLARKKRLSTPAKPVSETFGGSGAKTKRKTK
jgi:hypothetical protein